MTKDRKQFFTYIILTLVILLFIKVDYRFKEIFPGVPQNYVARNAAGTAIPV